MPVLHRDYETRSASDLKMVGARRYAADPSTELLCLGYAVDDGAVQIWTLGQPIPEVIQEAARNPAWIVAAHSDAFETAVEELPLGPRLGWPLVPIERHRCTEAMALAAALPGSLEGAAEALLLPLQKDRAGQKLMRELSRVKKQAAL